MRGKSNEEAYKIAEEAIIAHSRDTQKRTDIDPATKGKIVQQNAEFLDRTRKSLGIKE